MRINVEEAAKLWDKHRFLPVHHLYYDEQERSACLIGMLALDKAGFGCIGGEDQCRYPHIIKVLTEDFSKQYIYGLEVGFDEKFSDRNSVEFLAGYEDGQAVAKLLTRRQSLEG